jgi:hypothetical protein
LIGSQVVLAKYLPATHHGFLSFRSGRKVANPAASEDGTLGRAVAHARFHGQAGKASAALAGVDPFVVLAARKMGRPGTSSKTPDTSMSAGSRDICSARAGNEPRQEHGSCHGDERGPDQTCNPLGRCHGRPPIAALSTMCLIGVSAAGQTHEPLTLRNRLILRLAQADTTSRRLRPRV